jgi:phospholipase C
MKFARVVALVAVLPLSLAAAASSHAGRHAATSPLLVSHELVPAGIPKIRHVVIIMQENRSFDQYFGTYRGADGIPGLAGHPGKVPCLPDPNSRQVRAASPRPPRPGLERAPRRARGDCGHGRGVDGRFHRGTGKGAGGVQLPRACQRRQRGGGCHTGKEIPNYWTYARDFVLQDHMFESAASRSLVSHLYLVSEWVGALHQAQPSRELPQRAREPG